MRKQGFTLAEVLIALAVIGVIAAMTIPSLMSSTGDSETVAKVRETQAILNSVFKSYQANNGCIGGMSSCDLFTSGSNTGVIWDKFKPYLNLSKDCRRTSGCWPSGAYKDIAGNDDNPVENAGYGLPVGAGNIDSSNYFGKGVLANGTLIAFLPDGTGGSSACGAYYNTAPLDKMCGYILTDINGAKSPNAWGVDLFGWAITDTGVYPFGITGDYYNWNNDINDSDCVYNSASSTGKGCAAYVLKYGKSDAKIVTP